MKIVLTSDSVCDLPKELLIKNNITVIPFGITLGDELKFDGIDITPKLIFEYVKENKILPKTNAINEYDYTEFFKKMLENADAVIHMCISSEISSTYNNAVNASKNFDNVYVIDTLNLTTGIGLLLLYASELIQKGEDVKTIVEKVNARRSAVQTSFVIEKLDYLHKGGRCSSLQLLGANLLKIRPSIILSNGKMGMHKKYRGKMEDVVKSYVKDTFAEFSTPDLKYCFLTYSTATPEMIEAAYKVIKENANFENIIEATAGATVTSHCGQNTIGIIYFNDGNAAIMDDNKKDKLMIKQEKKQLKINVKEMKAETKAQINKRRSKKQD